jgi:hypothetical protein
MVTAQQLPLSSVSRFRALIGQFADSNTFQTIPIRRPHVTITDFYHQTRALCESLYCVFLNGYQPGLEAYWNYNMEKAKAKGRGRRSTPKWRNATLLANAAITAAKLGWIQWEEDKVEESKRSTEIT